MGRKDIEHPWLFERCREVQNNPDNHLDLWSREHYKSTIITYAKTIQDILASHGDFPTIDRELTFGIFSMNRPNAKKFLAQIKQELENNKFLIDLFPDVLYENPDRDAKNWSLDTGITVKRKTNPKESTVEAWGLVDSMPTGAHFAMRIYDDVITEKYARSPEMIQKTTESWELSINLGARGGAARYIGTRYHANDTYRTILQRQAATPRIYPATEDGTVEGKPVFLSPDELADKRRAMGPYTFSCHDSHTGITMSDWSQKPIGHIVPGDEVVGWVSEKGKKSKLVKTKVLAVNKRRADAVHSEIEGGHILTHTPDHKWWTGRTEKGREYSPLGASYGMQSTLCQAIEIENNLDLSESEIAAAGYLAGMIDGEGGVNHQAIQITQDCDIHPEVCEKIEWSMNELGIKYGICDKKRDGRKGTQRIYTIHGGRQARLRLLDICGDYLAKKDHIIRQCYGARNFGKGAKLKLVNQWPAGEIDVYNIQTETGNYLAEGFCSKNCQMLQNPVADETQGFNKDWLKFHQGANPGSMNTYILVDPANEKKKTSDYTAIEVVGLGPDNNYYTLDLVRDRLSLTERADALFELHRRWQPIKVGYERYGMQADIDHIRDRMRRETYHFEIVELGGNIAKNDRIKKLVPIFEQGRWYLPESCHKTDYEGKVHELVDEFIHQEYLSFPVPVHDDMLDVKARILDKDLGAIFPKPKVVPDRYATGQRKRRKGSSWAN